MWSVRIEADSISECGVRLTTWICSIPRIILAQLEKHRVFSLNVASSRAVPVKKMLQRVMDDPFIPAREHVKKNKPGMSGGDELNPMEYSWFVEHWLGTRDECVATALALSGHPHHPVHKQTVNRLLEPFLWVDVVLSATDTANFFALRTHHDAQDEFQQLARMMYVALARSVPAVKREGEWHLPFVTGDDVSDLGGDMTELAKVSAARAGMVSYFNQGKASVEDALSWWDRHIENASPKHVSPCEHQAYVCHQYEGGEYLSEINQSNFSYPWLQHRKLVPGENCVEFSTDAATVEKWARLYGMDGTTDNRKV